MLFSHFEAADEAKKLIKKYHTNNPFELVKACDYNVVYIDLPAKTLGQTIRSNRCSTIFISNTLDNNEKKFILAHELGHCRLHEGFSTPFFNKIDRTVISQKERQANEFALVLLCYGEKNDNVLYKHNIVAALDYLGLSHDFAMYLC